MWFSTMHTWVHTIIIDCDILSAYIVHRITTILPEVMCAMS